MNERGTLMGIYIAANKAEPMQERDQIRAIAGKGLEGDRYANLAGTWTGIKEKRLVEPIRHVSLIASEAIALANLKSLANGRVDFLPQDTRRNLLTSGLDLNLLVGVRFLIGDVIMEGVELFEPCQIPSKHSGKPRFRESFDGIGGLRAEVFNTGTLKVGNRIDIFNSSIHR